MEETELNQRPSASQSLVDSQGGKKNKEDRKPLMWLPSILLTSPYQSPMSEHTAYLSIFFSQPRNIFLNFQIGSMTLFSALSVFFLTSVSSLRMSYWNHTLMFTFSPVDNLFLKSRNMARKLFSRSSPRSLAAGTDEWQDMRFQEKWRTRANASVDRWNKKRSQEEEIRIEMGWVSYLENIDKTPSS